MCVYVCACISQLWNNILRNLDKPMKYKQFILLMDPITNVALIKLSIHLANRLAF